MILGRGSILSIYAADPLATNVVDGVIVSAPVTSLQWNKLTEHNRSSFNVDNNRIEQAQRTSNGTLRKFFIADKKTFSVSWDMLPSYRTLTVDGAWGAEDIRSFYNSIAGQGVFKIKINLAKNGTNDTETVKAEEYDVVFTNCSFTVLKRGLQPHWSVSITLEEV
jgi:hypothetical protein